MSPSIAVLGSLHLDIVVHAPRLPLLGETLMGNRWEPIPGGKGLNQAVACARAGVATRMLGATGTDDFSAPLLAHLRQHQVDVSGVKQVADARSGMCVVTSESGGDYAAVVVSGVNATLDTADVAQWVDALAASSALVLQNEVPRPVNTAAARYMATLNRPVILNAAPFRALEPEDLAGVSLLVVNAVEAEMMGAAPVTDLLSAACASLDLQTRLGITVVVTAGPHGVAWTDTRGLSKHLAGKPVQVIATLGAGDTFVGHLAAALVNGSTLDAAVAAANEAAARFVSTPR
ncbi:ribokinase [Hydrogenophaga sp.]|uniref:ribokinase n=1 Tax=Hydrogenophaga sp. TaxID=1904254 RepID=UPI00356303B2